MLQSAITPYLHPQRHAELLRGLQLRDITAQGELCVRRRDGTLRWNNDQCSSDLRAALGVHAIPLPCTDAITLATGQIYHLMPNDHYLEYQGLLATASTPTALFRKWQLHPTSSQLRCPTAPLHPLQHLPLTSLLSQQWNRLTNIPSPRVARTWASRRILHTTLCDAPHIPQPGINVMHCTLAAFLHDVAAAQRATGTTYALFTDGSFSIRDLPYEAILTSEHERRQHGSASAAIVAPGPPTTWRTQPLIALRLTHSSVLPLGTSSYTTETLALCLAVLLAQHLSPDRIINPIYSDCKAAIATVSAAITPLAGKRAAQRQNLLISAIRRFGPARITWTRGHPERVTPADADWTYTDWGIHLADAAASPGTPPLHHIHAAAPVVIHSMPLLDALKQLTPPATWHWLDTTSALPTLCSPLPLVQHQRVHSYLQRRDSLWRDPLLPPRWVGTSLERSTLSQESPYCDTALTNAGMVGIARKASHILQKPLLHVHVRTALSFTTRCMRYSTARILKHTRFDVLQMTPCGGWRILSSTNPMCGTLRSLQGLSTMSLTAAVTTRTPRLIASGSVRGTFAPFANASPMGARLPTSCPRVYPSLSSSNLIASLLNCNVSCFVPSFSDCMPLRSSALHLPTAPHTPAPTATPTPSPPRLQQTRLTTLWNVAKPYIVDTPYRTHSRSARSSY